MFANAVSDWSDQQKLLHMLNIDKAFHLCASECGLSIPMAEAFTTISTFERPRVYPHMDFKKRRTVESLPTNCAVVALRERLRCWGKTCFFAFLDGAGFFNRAWVVFNWDKKGIEKCLFNYKVKKRKIYIAEKWGFYRENNVLLHKVVAFQAGTNC